MHSTIRFASAPYYDDDERLIWFTAFTRGGVIPCAISWDTMRAHFDCSAQSPRDCFRRWRAHIHSIARKVIAAGRLENDGSIHIALRDCQWQRSSLVASVPAAPGTAPGFLH